MVHTNATNLMYLAQKKCMQRMLNKIKNDEIVSYCMEKEPKSIKSKPLYSYF
jgi:hypothetical protein